jgi:glycosyltransferase involved in cell wall biosynthesis
MSASAAEGVSNSLCEAMACGVLPVVTDVGDSRVVVDRFGAVVPVGRPDLLAQMAMSSLDIETSKLKDERRQWIVDSFGIDRMVDDSLRVFATAARRT